MANIVLKISTPSGMQEDCEVEFAQVAPFRIVAQSSLLGKVEVQDISLFGALSQLRLKVEEAGCRLLCNGARRNAYPSRMSLEMGGGRKVYLLQLGQQARRTDMVDIFSFSPAEHVATVQEQRDYYEEWIRSLQ